MKSIFSMIFGTREILPKDFLAQQWLGGIGSMLIMFVTGLMSGWSSPYLAILTGADSPLPITKDEASWVAACLNLGRMVGAPLGAIGVYSFGSKRTLVANGLPLMACWVLIVMADSVIWLYGARFAAGIGLGMALSCYPLYLGEIASPSIRGALVGFGMFGSFLGNFVGNAMGPYVSMNLFAYVSMIPNVMLIFVFLCIPESPYYLVRVNRIEDAKRSIASYNPKADAKLEVESIKQFQDDTTSQTILDRIREFNVPRNRKAATILVALLCFQQFSGLNSVLFYAEMLLVRARLTMIPPSTVVIIVGGVGVPSGLAAMYLTERFGRRVLMILSSTGVGSAMLGLGIHFALLDNGFDSVNLQWLPMSSLIVSQISLCIGLNVIPNTILSELFAPNIKSMVACCSSFLGALLSFLATKSYQPLIDTIGASYLFFLHAVIMACSLLFSVILMPETKGKSLQEIQILMTKK